MTYRAWDLKTLDRAAVRELTHAIAEQRTEEMEYSAMDEEPWSEQKYAATLAAQQKETALLAGILAARGITDPADALTLLAGEEELSDPALLTDMEKACQRIWQAIDNGETIVVFGDYDVDGVTATALLYQHLKGMGAAVKCMLPSREGDGYGLSRNAIQSIHDKGYRLIVTVDNGISAVAEADFAAELGIDLIITDHHLPPETLPKAVAVVDPRREDDTSPFKGLCGAGVAFKLCAALDDCTPEEMLDYCGDLAAVGTVADVMPLTGENRTLVKAGLRQLQQTDRPGMEALLEEVGLAGKTVTAENISYAIAPRINAAGRMDSAVTALQLVLCEDPDRAEELAHKLNEINAKRQETELQIFKAAEELLEQQPERLEDRVILLWGRDWHPGVIGIVAARLMERFGRPVIVISMHEGEGRGSGRAPDPFDLHSALAGCAQYLTRFGGHAAAAGVEIEEDNLPAFRQAINAWAADHAAQPEAVSLQLDAAVTLGELSLDNVQELGRLAPFGRLPLARCLLFCLALGLGGAICLVRLVEQRLGLLIEEGLVGRAAALGDEEEFVLHAGMAAVNVDLCREVRTGILLLGHRERHDLRIAQVAVFVGLVHALGNAFRIVGARIDVLALMADADGRAGILACGKFALGRNDLVEQHGVGHELVVVGGLGIIEDVAQFLQVGGAQVERHVAVRGFGQEFEACGVDLEDLAAVALHDFHILLRQKTVLGFVVLNRKRLLIDEFCHDRICLLFACGG